MSVQQHFQVSSSHAHKGRLLYHCAASIKARRILEVGTAYGLSSAFLLQGALSEADGYTPELDTIEYADLQHEIASEQLSTHFGNHIRCHYGAAEAEIARLTGDHANRFDLVFYDGPHEGAAYVRDFESLLPSLAPGALYVLDDIHWHDKRFVSRDPECYAGWQHVANHASVAEAVEIDGSLGLVRLHG